MAVTAKDCHAMTSYYDKIYKEKFGKSPNTNRYAARWGFDAVLQSMGSEQAKDLLHYYLTTPSTRGHDLEWFFYHYHELAEAMLKSGNDAEHRKKLMEESKLRAEQWRASGKQSITNA